MALTRFPDHEDKRVFLSTVRSFQLAPPDTAFSGRVSMAVLWVDQDSLAHRELSPEFATGLLAHRALAVVCGGSAAEVAATIFDEAAAEGDFTGSDLESVGIWCDPDATLETILWTAAEEAMPPDSFTEDPWDIVVWARDGDWLIPRLRRGLGSLSGIVDRRYELGGEDDT